MDQIIEGFEKALAEYAVSLGKKDNLVGFGEIVVAELKKQRQSVVTLGNLLADFYAAAENKDPAEAGSATGVVLRLNPRRRAAAI